MYRVLYRKWRPQRFSDVIGQPQVTLTLTSQLRENRLSHAYLFTGSRGTGKTSCAKILAKAVNCLNPKDGEPCCECEICRGIDDGTVLDIVEMDAASNRGIDDIRLLREEVNFTPSKAKYRVYIIDEVHMLTIEAFNALLKTLEEPPEHVLFILATTEVHKLPSTILSRCQRFDFHRIEPEIIAERLVNIAEAEETKLDFEAAVLIAKIADGGMRDALSLLDRCISLTAVVDQKTVASVAGLMGRGHLNQIMNSIANKDTASCLALLDELHKSSCDTGRLITELIDQFRNLLIIKTVNAPENLIICTKNELEEIKMLSELFTSEEIIFALNVLSETTDALRRTQSRRIEAEMALIKLCRPESVNDFTAMASRISSLEKEIERLKSGNVVFAAASTINNAAHFEAHTPLPVTATHGEPVSVSETEAGAAVFSQPSTSKGVQTPSVFNDAGKEKVSGRFAPSAEVDEDDDEPFDYDTFMAQYSGDDNKQDKDTVVKTEDIVKSSESEADEALPFSDEASEAASPVTVEKKPSASEADNISRLDERTWLRVVLETEKFFPPMIGVFTDSTAYIKGDTIFIHLGNKNASLLVTEERLNIYVARAVSTVLSKNYYIKLDNGGY